MSEVLRAIFDKNCVYSQTAFYTIGISVPITSATLALARRQGQLACQADRWFLCMGAAQDNAAYVTAPAVAYGWIAKATPTTFEIVRGSTGEAFAIAPQQQSLVNYNLNNFVSFDEYIPFGPSELIQINEDVEIGTAIGTAGTMYPYVTLVGVEYQFGPGGGPSVGT